MKYIQPIVILTLLILLIFSLLHSSYFTNKLDDLLIKQKIDSAIRPHQKAIIQIEQQRKKIIVKLSVDSAKHYQESQVFRKQITDLRKQLRDVKYTGNPSTVPDDSVKIAMQALKEAPVKDSIISVQDKEIVSLNDHIVTNQKDYSDLLDAGQQELNQEKKISEDWKKAYASLEDQNKKQRRKGVWQSVKVGVVALGVGYVIGLSR